MHRRQSPAQWQLHQNLLPTGRRSQKTENSSLFDSLRELGHERSVEVDGCRLRVGLATNDWQLRQARLLIDALQPRSPAHPLALSSDDSAQQIIALAMRVVPAADTPRTQAILVLRRDGPTGLALDARYATRLARLRTAGEQLAEIELVAFHDVGRLGCILPAVVNVIHDAAQRWGITTVLAESPRSDAGAYCHLLGFRPVGRTTDRNEKLLLAVDARRVRRPAPDF